MIVFYIIPYILLTIICISGIAGVTQIFSVIINHPIIVSVLFMPVCIFLVIAVSEDNECCFAARIYNSITCAILQSSLLLFVFAVSKYMVGKETLVFTTKGLIVVSLLEIITHLCWMVSVKKYRTFGKIFTGTACAVFGSLLGLTIMGY